jgi:hypothetical protein
LYQVFVREGFEAEHLALRVHVCVHVGLLREVFGIVGLALAQPEVECA